MKNLESTIAASDHFAAFDDFNDSMVTLKSTTSIRHPNVFSFCSTCDVAFSLARPMRFFPKTIEHEFDSFCRC
jgi:hypothetical protein